MNRHRPLSSRGAFTLLEMLVVCAVLIVLLLFMLPVTSGPHPPPQFTRCMNNLRQIGSASYMFAADNHDRFPAQALATNSASFELLAPDSPAIYFIPLHPYLRQLETWVCPTDKLKIPATNSTPFHNRNVSYFLSLEAPTGALIWAIYAGDRHLNVDRHAVKPGLFSLRKNSAVGWTRELHPYTAEPRGSLLFADGHAEFRGTNFAHIVSVQPFQVTRLAIP